MRTGLFLQGGGAKGAFQAGAIAALSDRGIDFDVIAGTSIGAINGYFVYTEFIEQMKNTWLADEWNVIEEMHVDDDVIENRSFINSMGQLPLDNVKDRNMYVNYIHISSGKMIELYDNIAVLDQKTQLERIRYSALLPRAKESLGDKFTTMNAFIVKSFLRDLKTGRYEAQNLDGGILNNSFMKPFTHDVVDRIFAIVFDADFTVPQSITDIYDESQIYVIKPDIPFGEDDTFRFETGFCTSWFARGYDLASKINI